MESFNPFFVILFTVSVFFILYSYVIFPLLLGVLSRNRKISNEVLKSNYQFPGVSIIISVFNEESVIEEKINSILNSNFPKENLEIIIGSDSSTDRTTEIVKKFASSYPFIKVYEFPERRGKPAVINDLVSFSKNQLIILTDANVFFEKQMIVKLLRHFNDSKTGLVGANILNIGMKKDGISMQEKSYIQRENLIKYREGILWGCMMGPFGGCYALRKELFENVPEGFLVDDFYISMKVIEKKHLCINDLEAVCYEDVPNDIRQEYRRKSRISAGNFQNLKMFSHFLLRPFTPEGFCFISHKFIRWLTPFLIILSLISLITLSFTSKIYLYLLAGEILLIFSPAIDWVAGKLGLHLRILRFTSYFSYMNLALLKGFFNYIRGIKSGVWTPTKRK